MGDKMNWKFRGLTEDKKWVEGDLVHNAYNGSGKTIDVGIQVPGYYPVEVLPETVGAFTGRKCAKDQDVFTGDIFETHDHTARFLLVVRYDELTAMFGFDVYENEIDKECYCDFESLNEYHLENMEKIGNVHEGDR